MKKLVLLAALICLAAPASAGHIVKGHFRKDGAYVGPHYARDPGEGLFGKAPKVKKSRKKQSPGQSLTPGRAQPTGK